MFWNFAEYFIVIGFGTKWASFNYDSTQIAVEHDRVEVEE